MTGAADSAWADENQRYISAAVAWLRDVIEHGVHGTSSRHEVDSITVNMQPPPALERLSAIFGLTPFERDLLLLCAGVELDATLSRLIHERLGDVRPTFSLALAILPEPHWSALTPTRPLRAWSLVDVLSGPTLTTSPLRVDEHILHIIAGMYALDPRLHGVVQPAHAPAVLPPTYRALADRVVRLWDRDVRAEIPIVQFSGPDLHAQVEIAASSASQLGLVLHVADARLLPSAAADVAAIVRHWEREYLLTRSPLLLDCHDIDADDPRGLAAGVLAERTNVPIVVASRERRVFRRRMAITIEVDRPTRDEQRALWQAALPDLTTLNGSVDRVVDGLDLAPIEIVAASGDAMAVLRDDQRQDSPSLVLWDAARGQARPRLEGLAVRIEPSAEWDDLVLPELQRATLRDIATHVRHRARVYEEWGFQGKGSRGLGISALFSGASGTGKTTAAEVLASELRLDLYRIDLSSVVSKYIGETEKNLRRIFDAAEGGGAILLFDEADALFGKRSEVRDSHDRYANIEVSYLLQRMETYRGLAILTTNLRGAIDAAFTRRIRFIVPFPFPDAVQREAIWRRAFPPATPTKDLAYDRLSQLSIPGGTIRNIALAAAFLAAADNQAVGMRHVLAAARGEYAKIEKPMTSAEIEGWVVPPILSERGG